MTIKIQESLSRYWFLFAASVLAIITMWGLFPAYSYYWNDPDGYYTHAPLVPLVFIYLVWKNRARLAHTELKGSWFGIVLLLFSIAWVLGGMVAQAETVCGPGVILLLLAVVWSIMGIRALKILAFPILFLYTAIPLPPGMLDGPTGGMQIMSSTVAAKIMQLTGIELVRNGNVIESSAFPSALQVAGACSGLKLLISTLMFSFFFAYITRTPWWKKIVLVLFSFPLSILINSLRIVAIGYAGAWTYSDTIMGKVHDYSAVPALVVAFLLFLLLAKILKARDYHDFDADSSTTSVPRMKVSPASITAVILLALSAMYGMIVVDLNQTPKGKLDPGYMPTAFGTWTSQESPVDKDTRQKLAKADLDSRVYYDRMRTTDPVLVFMSTAIDPIALHDPHTCLPGGGQRIVKEEPMVLNFDKPVHRTVNATLLTTEDQIGTKGLILHWYVSEDATYPDTKIMNIAYYKQRVKDLCQVMVHPFAVQSIKNEVFSRQIRWYRFSIDESSGADVEYLKGFIREFVASSKW